MLDRECGQQWRSTTGLPGSEGSLHKLVYITLTNQEAPFVQATICVDTSVFHLTATQLDGILHSAGVYIYRKKC